MAHVNHSQEFDAEVLYILGTSPNIALADLQHRIGLPKAKDLEQVKQSLHRLHNQGHISGALLSRLVRED